MESDPFTHAVSVSASSNCNIVTEIQQMDLLVLLWTISGSDGSGDPFALAEMNDGTTTVMWTAILELFSKGFLMPYDSFKI